MKSVIILGILDLKVRVAVTSVIDIAAAVYWVTVSRYFSPAEQRVNANELKDPIMGAVVSP